MNLFYFPLEPVKSRYTYQLCKLWMPDSFKHFDWNVITIEGKETETDIKVGHVLDSIGRNVYSYSQIENFLINYLDKGLVKENDILFFQDFWTPGMEGIQYALDLHHIKTRWYSMLHAQSIDEYDFTYNMRDWMRPFELGIDALHKNGGIFVGSSIHRDQLREAGFKSPIHVMSLPLGLNELRENQITKTKKKQVTFNSRMNSEKNPLFMINVAKLFLQMYPDWEWVVTTSSKEFKTDNPIILTELRKLANQQSRFILKENLSKDEYYGVLAESTIQFNSSLQDYVSWTLLEGLVRDCIPVYPNFRSFPECIDNNNLYKPFVVSNAVNKISEVIEKVHFHPYKEKEYLLTLSNFGRLFESYIMYTNMKEEFNIWTDYEKGMTLWSNYGNFKR